ncbi:FadR/GntR family transcriptional regulator [Salinibacterium sp. TMP30]|uniref:FadR/GntR family transcriptional regulator n=1 Tax=Salinibacterium sp. TMP30 TaxID=3138237 RepID=UPI00313A1E64
MADEAGPQSVFLTPSPVSLLELRSKGVHGAVALAAEVERLIVSGAIADGARLPTERELAELLGMSRASVREAMYELSLKGIVDRRRSRGSVVVFDQSSSNRLLHTSMPRDEREFWEVVEFRSEIEPVIASRAALTATPSDLVVLREILRAQEDSADVDSAIANDRAFHIQIASLTHNQLFVRLAEVSAEWLVPTRKRSQSTMAGRRRSIAEHRLILDAIAANDPERASEAMRTHIESVAELAQMASPVPRVVRVAH